MKLGRNQWGVDKKIAKIVPMGSPRWQLHLLKQKADCLETGLEASE